MADILSLSKARKTKARLEKEAAAQQNRIRHGLTKAEKQRLKAESAKAADMLEAHKRKD
jgi:hypothetical protein